MIHRTKKLSAWSWRSWRGRILLACMVLLVALVTTKVMQARARRNLAKTLELAGAEVQYFLEYTSNPTLLRFLRQKAGLDFVDFVCFVRLNNTTVNVEQLRCISELDRLGEVELNDTDLNDTTLRCLEGNDQLEYLRIRGTLITDTGLKSVERIPRLRLLDVRETAVTEQGCSQLQQKMPGLMIVR